MQNVRELLAGQPEMRPTEVKEAEGFLLVTKQLTVLFPSDQERQFGIIVPTPGLVDQWLKFIPPFGGSRVYFTGAAKVRAKFAASGIQPLPLIALDLERVEFVDRHGNVAVYEPQD
jgi:hypothetical protein